MHLIKSAHPLRLDEDRWSCGRLYSHLGMALRRHRQVYHAARYRKRCGWKVEMRRLPNPHEVIVPRTIMGGQWPEGLALCKKHAPHPVRHEQSTLRGAQPADVAPL